MKTKDRLKARKERMEHPDILPDGTKVRCVHIMYDPELTEIIGFVDEALVRLRGELESHATKSLWKHLKSKMAIKPELLITSASFVHEHLRSYMELLIRIKYPNFSIEFDVIRYFYDEGIFEFGVIEHPEGGKD